MTTMLVIVLIIPTVLIISCVWGLIGTMLGRNSEKVFKWVLWEREYSDVPQVNYMRFVILNGPLGLILAPLVNLTWYRQYDETYKVWQKEDGEEKNREDSDA